jgi:hypothetical protein
VGIDPPNGNDAVDSALLMSGSGTPIPQEALGGAFMGDIFGRFSKVLMTIPAAHDESQLPKRPI